MAEEKAQISGNTIIKNVKNKHKELADSQEIQYSSATFNPFSAINRKTQEAKIQKVYLENDSVTHNTKGDGIASELQDRLTERTQEELQTGGLTIGTTSTATEAESSVSSSEFGSDGLSSDTETADRKSVV